MVPVCPLTTTMDLYPGQTWQKLFGAMTASVALHVVAAELVLNQLSHLPPSEPAPKIIEITLLAPEPPVKPVAVIEPEPAPQPQLLETAPAPVTSTEPETQATTEPESPSVVEPEMNPEPEAMPEPAPKPIPRKAKKKEPEKPVVRRIAKAGPAIESPIAVIETVQKNEVREQPDPDTANDSNAEPTAAPAEVRSELAAVAPAKSSEASLTPPHFDVAYLNNPKPAYPAAARRFNLEGTVILRVMVKASGLPETVRIGQSSGAGVLDEAALAAVKGWRFVPARQGDTPIDHWVEVPMRFRLTSAHAE